MHTRLLVLVVFALTATTALAEFAKGDAVEARSRDKWYAATVVETGEGDGHRYKVHFEGWTDA